MSRSSASQASDGTQYVLDSSAIIRNPEILEFSAKGVDLVILPQTIEEIGVYRKQSHLSGLQGLVFRSLTAGLIRVADIRSYTPQIRGSAVKGVDTAIIVYVLDQLSKDIKTVCVSLDKDLLVPLGNRGAAITPDAFFRIFKESNITPPVETIGLIEFRRRSRIWLGANVIGSALSATAAIAIYNHFDVVLRYIFIFAWISGTMFTVLIGFSVYWLRQNYRVPYAVAEITVGIISVLTSVNLSASFPTTIGLDINTSIKLAGGLYIVVRGLDNLGKGLEGRRVGIYWKRYLG